MGWVCCDLPGDLGYEHEGYLVGVIRDGFGWRDLRAEDGRVAYLSHVQVACDCGWRSPRMATPLGTGWAPCSVTTHEILYAGLADAFEDAAHDMWAAHVESVTADTPSELLTDAHARRQAAVYDFHLAG